ncbi:MAG: hypothetical protein H0U44_03465 [Flavisolibacter sp.]|jgi:ferredoxin|nr:hypothetical protein [Flavisolibacter sp.]
MTITHSQTQACFDAWIKCENLLTNLAKERDQFSKEIIKVMDECALICMGTFHAIKSYSPNIRNFALLCVGICEECAEICETEMDERLKECAAVCRRCSKYISTLAFSSLP